MKLQTYFKAIFTFILFICSMSGYGQERVKEQAALQQKRQQKAFYKKELQVDSVKAGQVTDIQDVYKSGLKVLMADTSLSPAARTVKIRSLMETKNQQLRKLLTPAQQEKVIPSSERLVQPLKKD